MYDSKPDGNRRNADSSAKPRRIARRYVSVGQASRPLRLERGVDSRGDFRQLGLFDEVREIGRRSPRIRAGEALQRREKLLGRRQVDASVFEGHAGVEARSGATEIR